MRKILALTLAGIVVLGACGGNDDDKTKKTNHKDSKDKQETSKNNNTTQKHNNSKQKNNNTQENTTNQKVITPEQAKKIVKDKNNNGALTELSYNKEKSNNNRIYIDFMGPGAIDRIPMQAIVDAHSGELLDKYVNETEEHKAMRAQYHLNTPQIINKLNDSLIEEYQPEAYNKIKNYAQKHPNAFSKDDGQANQRLVNKILGNQEEPNNSENTNENQNNNDETIEEDHDKENKNEQPNSNNNNQEDSQQQHTNQNEPQQNDSEQDTNSNEDEDN